MEIINNVRDQTLKINLKEATVITTSATIEIAVVILQRDTITLSEEVIEVGDKDSTETMTGE